MGVVVVGEAVGLPYVTCATCLLNFENMQGTGHINRVCKLKWWTMMGCFLYVGQMVSTRAIIVL